MIDFDFGFVTYSFEMQLGNHKDCYEESLPGVIAAQKAIELFYNIMRDTRPIKITYSIPKYIKEREDRYINETVEYANEAWVREFGKDE